MSTAANVGVYVYEEEYISSFSVEKHFRNYRKSNLFTINYFIRQNSTYFYKGLVLYLVW